MLRPICLYILFVLLLITSSDGFSQQLKLGKNPSAVIKSAVLELESTNQGLLFPRLTDTAGINLFSPPDGMVIYLTTAKQLYVRSNGRWSVLTSGTIDTTSISSFYLKVRSLHAGTAPITYNNTTGVIGITQASSTTAGYLSAADWNTFNTKLSSITQGNLTETGSGILTITGGTNAVVGSGTTIQVKQASGSQNGFLSNTDWTTFNNKQAALSGTGFVKISGTTISYDNNTYLTSIDSGNIANFSYKVRTRLSGTAPITYNSTTGAIGITQASSTTDGYLSSTDWTTFNNKLSSNNVWTRQGNAGTNAGTDFIGTTDNQDLIFKTNSTERWRIENSTGDIKIGSATSGTFKATKELVMREDGDTYGASILRLRNRNAENGAIFETTTTDPGATLVDFIFKTSVDQRNIRYESRPTYSLVGVPAFHIGGSNPDVPNLAVGDNYSAFNTKLKIGNYTTPTEMLDVAGNMKFSGALMPGGSAGTSGQYLKSNGTGSAPTWTSLSFLSDPGSNGILARTASNTLTNRTITGTANEITVTNGDGVSGNPTIDISSTYAGQSSITTLGTIGTGTWQGTKVAEAYGGTNQTTYTKGDILYASATNTLTKLNIGSTGERLVVLNGVPTWEAPATYQASPGDPTANSTTTTTAKMMGLAGSITPTISGKIMIIISGDVNNNTANSGAQIQIRYGIGSAPSNGSTTMSGNAAGTALKMVSNNGSNRMPFTCNAVVTGLTIGTTYWIDVSLAAITSGTVAIKGISISVVEL